jgi:hypothetical protein
MPRPARNAVDRWISDIRGTRAAKEAQQMAQRIVINPTFLSRVSKTVRYS